MLNNNLVNFVTFDTANYLRTKMILLVFNCEIRDWTISSGNGLRFQSTKSLEGHTSAIFSPVYPYSYLSNSTCFFFKMLMNGSGMGNLNVYILPENNAGFESRTPLVTFEGNQVMNNYLLRRIKNYKKFSGAILAFMVCKFK